MTWVFSLVTTCRGPTAPSVSGGIAVKLSASPWNPLKFGFAVAAADGAISGCRAGVPDGFAEFRRRTARSGSWLSRCNPVSYTHLRAHETVLDLVCRLLLEK